MPPSSVDSLIQSLKRDANEALARTGLDMKIAVKLAELAAKQYHSEGHSVLTDSEYDLLLDRISQDAKHASILTKVGHAPLRGKKVPLPAYMGSLNKIKPGDKALTTFFNPKTDFLISEKLDGVSALYTSDMATGRKQLFTRGDGSIGQDISGLLSMIDISANLPKGAMVRGELIIPKDKFIVLKSHGANLRNIVSGLVNSKDYSAIVASQVRFVAYQVVFPHGSTPGAEMTKLTSWGFHTAPHAMLRGVKSSVDLEKELSDLLESHKASSCYEIDGLVVAYDRVYTVEDGRNPSHAVAFKSSAVQDAATVTVTMVEWSASKDGYLIPVVFFDPVHLAGVMVRKATGFNAKFIFDHKIGPGAIITVTRSGDVIPHIMNIVKSSSDPSVPQVAYVMTDTGVHAVIADKTGSMDVQCKSIERFFTGIGVPNMKKAAVEKMYLHGLDTVGKILGASKEELQRIPGFGQKSAESLVSDIHDRFSTALLIDIMAASNTFGRGVAWKKLYLILESLPEWTTPQTTTHVNLVRALQKAATRERLESIKGISATTADAFIKGLAEFLVFMQGIPAAAWEERVHVQGQTDVQTRDLKDLGAQRGGSFKDQFVVFTGFRSQEVEDYITSQGGTIQERVNKETTMVIYSGKPTRKLEAAIEKGLKTMTREEVLEKISS